MESNSSFNNIFKDYNINDKGILFKSFSLNLNSMSNNYDIYWGDPNIIFDKKSLKEEFPLAVTYMPHRKNNTKSRIYLHQELNNINNSTLEMIITHEIGHLWLHDVHGFDNPMTNINLSNHCRENWADYFAYCFFIKYRRINCLKEFNHLLEDAGNLQIKIYHLTSENIIKLATEKRINDLKIKDDEIKLKESDVVIKQMINGIELTLNVIGDIFK